MIPNPLRWAVAALVLALGVDAARMHVAAANLRTEHAEYVAKAEARAKKSSEDARLAEQEHAEDIAKIVAAHREEADRARKDSQSLIADVRSGAERLRKSLSCPSAEEYAAAAAAGRSDATANRGFGRADAEAAFRIAADGDKAIRQLQACQAVVEAQRKTCNGDTK